MTQAFGGVSLAEKSTFVMRERGLGRVVFCICTLALHRGAGCIGHSRDRVIVAILVPVQCTTERVQTGRDS